MKNLVVLLAAVLLIGLFLYFRSSLLSSHNTFPQSEASSPLPASLDPDKIDPQSTSILIDKSDYLLYLLEGKDTLKSYPVVLGPNPKGDKQQEGDGRTPEGDFKLKSLYPHKKWSRFLWIDYPNEESWRRFKSRKSRGELSAKAEIGGEIGIHGVPKGRDDLIRKKRNWTLGCISLTNDDIEEIYELVQEGTLVRIVP